MKNWLSENWFKVVVIILLAMCYSRLGEINDNLFYVADITDLTGSKIQESIINLE